MVSQHSSYRDYLKTVLEQRSVKNPKYSLRAMAKSLGVSPATLSGVLNGKKNFSIEKANTVCKALGLKGKQAEVFLLFVQLESTSNEDLKNATFKKLKSLGATDKSTDLSLEHFRIISDWYHYAILSFTEISGFKFSKEAIPKVARALGITKIELESAIERLIKLEMLQVEKGIYKSTYENVCAEAMTPNLALRNYHKQLLQKAIQSLETQTPKEKYIGSETIAIDSSKLKEFSEITEEYFNKVLLLAKESNKKDQVYHLGVQFFRLTEKVSL